MKRISKPRTALNLQLVIGDLQSEKSDPLTLQITNYKSQITCAADAVQDDLGGALTGGGLGRTQRLANFRQAG